MKKEVFDKLMEVGNEEVQQFLNKACPEFAGPNRKERERDEWFLEILKDLRVRHITKDDVVWENSDGEWIFQDTKYGYFWCSWYWVWSVLKNKYGMKHSEVQHYIKSKVLEHLSWKVGTPQDHLVF